MDISDAIFGILFAAVVLFCVFGIANEVSTADQRAQDEKAVFIDACTDLGGDVSITNNGKLTCTVSNEKLKEE